MRMSRCRFAGSSSRGSHLLGLFRSKMPSSLGPAGLGDSLRGEKEIDGAPDRPGGHWATVTAWPDPMSTISGIAAHARIADWHTLWDDPHNAGLRAHRTTPEHVQPGDAVWVPAP